MKIKLSRHTLCRICLVIGVIMYYFCLVHRTGIDKREEEKCGSGKFVQIGKSLFLAK